MNASVSKRTVRVDVDGVRAWRPTIPTARIDQLRAAGRIEFDHCESVSGDPPRHHVWMAQIWCCSEPEFGLIVPLRLLTLEGE